MTLPAGALPFVAFGQALRQHGFAVATDQTIDFLKAMAALGPRSFRDIYWSARATFAPVPERLGDFDALFHAMFRGGAGAVAASESSGDDDVPTGESGATDHEPTAAERANESGSAATGAEPLVAGKPQPPLHQESITRTGARNPLVVGDRLDTDIQGAVRGGVDSLLVFTGVTTPAQLVAALAERQPSLNVQ